MKFKIVLFLFLGILLSCNNDDDNPMETQDPMEEPTIEELREASLLLISSGSTKTWRITNAELVNDNGNFNISDNFNIQDDDFTIDNNGGIIWEQRYDIDPTAASATGANLDYYLGPIEGTLTFLTDSSTELEGLNGRLSLVIVDENTLTGSLTFDGRLAAGQVNFTLGERTPESYPQPPAGGLNFSLVSTNPNGGNIFGEGTAGFIGSYSDNSLFVVSRRDDVPPTSEQILKYSLSNGQWTENLYNEQQFVTRRLNIINNELVAFGGQNVNTYPLNPNGAPTTSFNHELLITRFGFAVQNDFGFIVGGDTQTPVPSEIVRYNYLTNELQQVTTLPKPRYYGGAEIVDNNLYVFGGRTEFIGEEVDSECFVVDLSNNQIDSFNMPLAPTMSFAAKLQNLIYVGYETREPAGEPGIGDDDRTINFGVYNTLDGSFTSLTHNLDDSDERSSIHGITIFNGSLYVIYGGSDVEPPFEFSIYSAPL